jgi:hypothetical protein
MSLHNLSILWLRADDPHIKLPLSKPLFSIIFFATNIFSPPYNLLLYGGENILVAKK